jgi:hypothetical protein
VASTLCTWVALQKLFLHDTLCGKALRHADLLATQLAFSGGPRSRLLSLSRDVLDGLRSRVGSARCQREVHRAAWTQLQVIRDL